MATKKNPSIILREHWSKISKNEKTAFMNQYCYYFGISRDTFYKRLREEIHSPAEQDYIMKKIKNVKQETELV